MGCDIHGHIEYKEYDQWWHFCDMFFGRDYNVFAHAANVRGKGLFQPRGIPKDITYNTLNAYTLRLDNDPVDGECTREQADDYVNTCGSEWWDDTRVTHPDWHTPSWLTVDELIQIREQLAYKHRGLDAVIGAMQGLACECRFVFWFDN